MSDNNQAGTACDLRGIREAVCVHTDKISDSCLAKDCIEDLQVYLTVPSQQALDCAVSAKARYVELLHVGVHVGDRPLFHGLLHGRPHVLLPRHRRCVRRRRPPDDGHGPRHLLEAARHVRRRDERAQFLEPERRQLPLQAGHPGRKRAGGHRRSRRPDDPRLARAGGLQLQLLPAVAPVIPEAILGCFEEQLVLDGESKRLLVTIGQFSIARLERSTQLLIPTFDYCIPSKTCKNVGSSNTESPCEVFGQIEFPMDAFFPSKNDSCIPAKDSCTNCAKTAT